MMLVAIDPRKTDKRRCGRCERGWEKPILVVHGRDEGTGRAGARRRKRVPIRAIGPPPPRQIFERLDDTLGSKQGRQAFFARVRQWDILRQLASQVEPGLDWTIVK